MSPRFITARITAPAHAPAARRALRAAGFSYSPARRRWVYCSPLGLRPIRLTLSRVKDTPGIDYQLHTPADFHAL